MNTPETGYAEVLDFWFVQTKPERWWRADPGFDALIRDTFSALLHAAARCELYAWRAMPAGRLAEIVVLDQFSRNIYRNTPQAFAQDPTALALAQEAVALGVQHALPPSQAGFLLMPYMHSESKAIHVQAERLFREDAPGNLEYELKHKAIIDRFGRYPHRNAVLGRLSTPEELEFLKQPDSSF